PGAAGTAAGASTSAASTCAPADCTDGLPNPTTPAWWTDRRYSRPVRLDVTVPVTTALGLSDEPGWLDGYGWISAPQCRQLLPRAELRQLCVSATGRLVDAADRVVRPDPTASGAVEALRRMVLFPYDITTKTWQQEPRHDPSPALDEFARLRDRFCDGPTGAPVPAARADLDHDVAYSEGPTAAWNLTARARRTHLLKHRGWTALRTPTSTLWFSHAGQVVEVDHWDEPPPDLDDAELPDPTVLAAVESELLRPLRRDEEPPSCPPPF
ncbi:MAG: hypothetical protein M3P93_17525, partial [Actinomycetota bacterium]|nr:hypothetical protein [Actinomycetota bacterium]